MEVQDIGTTSYLSVSSSYYSCNILLFNFYMNSEIFCPGCDTSLLTQTEAKDSFWIHYEFICRLSADLKWGNWQSIYNYSPFYLQGLWINKETSITSPTWITQFTGAVSDYIQTRTSLSALTPNREKISSDASMSSLGCVWGCAEAHWSHGSTSLCHALCLTTVWIYTRLLRISVSMQRETSHSVPSAFSIFPLFQRPINPSWVILSQFPFHTLLSAKMHIKKTSLKIGYFLIASETKDCDSSRWFWHAE